MSASAVMPSHHNDLYRYWNSVRGERATPTRGDIDPIKIVQLLPCIGLVERRADGYFWRLIGTAIVEHFGRDLTGERYGIRFSPASFVAEAIKSFDLALEQEVPFFDEFDYRSPGGGSPQAVSRLVCPLAADRSHLPMILHTRVHRFSNELLRSRCLFDQAGGDLRDRHPIYALTDLQRRTEEWVSRISGMAVV